jgi:hypothetical protein
MRGTSDFIGAGRQVTQNQLRWQPLAAALLLPFAISAATSQSSSILPVTNCNDAGNGSLREALAATHSGDTVDMTALTCGTISLSTGALQVAVDDLTLQGSGANALMIAGSQAASAGASVLKHTGRGSLHIDGLRVTANALPGSGQSCVESSGIVDLDHTTVTQCGGSGVYANGFSALDSTISRNGGQAGVRTTGGNVSITGSTISGNGGICGGLFLGNPGVVATALIVNTTISSNYAYYGPGAGCIYDRVTISNSTVAFNTSFSIDVSGLHIISPEATIESSIFAYNHGKDLVYDGTASPALPLGGHNNLIMATPSTVPADTITADPQLLPLADNGGPTQTHALAEGSPAIDAGNNTAALASDQRGSSFVRVAGAKADIGAFESQPAPLNTVSIGPGFTGSWFDPTQSGQGLMLEVLSDNRLLAFWFSFNPAGDQQAWFGGVGNYSGNTATITGVALPTGGRWIPNFDQNAIVLNPWGTLTFTFTDCNHGKVDFSSLSGYGSGSMNLTRLTLPAGLTCQ